MGSSLGCTVVLEIPAGSKAREVLKSLEDELSTILVVSGVEIVSQFSSDEPIAWAFQQPFVAYGVECKTWVLPPKDHKCPRCWRHVAEKEGDLCGRCAHVVQSMV